MAVSAVLIFVAITYQLIVVFPLGLPLDFLIPNTLVLVGCTALALLGSPFPAGPYQSVMVFFVIFFGVLPPLHLSEKVLFWGAAPVVLEYYAPAMIIAVFGIGALQLSYMAASKLDIPIWLRADEAIKQFAPLRFIVISLAAALLILATNKFSLLSVMVRGGDLKTLLPLGQTGHLIYQFFIFPIPSIAFVMYAVRAKKADRWRIVLALLMLLANPPTGMARFQAAALYLAAALAVFPVFMRLRPAIPLGLMFGMLLIFPVLEIFRQFGSPGSSSTRFIFQGHFDSFQSLAAALENGTVTWGYALLGVFLFFVPRAVWPDKPIGSGASLAAQEGYSFSNISMNFLGEGYVNFGLAGSIGFMLVAGVLLGVTDRRFWVAGGVTPRFKTQYLLSIGLLFFIMRGDLLSSFAFSAGLFTSVFFVYFLATVKTGGMHESNPKSHAL